VSFSCDDCGYKFNRVRTALGQPPAAKGKTLRLVVSADGPAPSTAASSSSSGFGDSARARDLNRLVVRLSSYPSERKGQPRARASQVSFVNSKHCSTLFTAL
jgi:ribosomal protein L37E